MPQSTTTFLTIETIVTYGGASIAVMAVTNTLRSVFGLTKAWIPLVVSLVVAYAGIYLVNDTINVQNGIISFFNACLLYASAAGLDHGLVAAGGGAETHAIALNQNGKPNWLSYWF
jgi:hypothetical protein